jgi:hypothetical protein
MAHTHTYINTYIHGCIYIYNYIYSPGSHRLIPINLFLKYLHSRNILSASIRISTPFKKNSPPVFILFFFFFLFLFFVSFNLTRRKENRKITGRGSHLKNNKCRERMGVEGGKSDQTNLSSRPIIIITTHKTKRVFFFVLYRDSSSTIPGCCVYINLLFYFWVFHALWGLVYILWVVKNLKKKKKEIIFF